MRKHLLVAGLIFCFSWAYAQNEESKNDTADYPYWIEMMQDEDANFFETQKAFYQYWEGREVTRGSGYKPFKRWESHMKFRVDEFGNRPAADKNYNAYLNLLEGQDTKSPAGNWSLVGPIDLPNPESGQPNGLGRINVTAFHPTDPNVLYIGAPAGGFWKTLDGGETWLTTTDRMPTLGVSAIAVNPKNPNEIYIGTGDRDASDAEGLGVFKSMDAGNTWKQYNNTMGNATVNKLLIYPETPSILLAATDQGIYKTTDAGESWSMVSSGTCKSMEFKPGSPDVIFAVKSSSLYRSTNNGESWNRVTSGLTSWSRAVVGVSPANPEYVYVLATNSQSFKALYRSTNGGDSFTTMSTTPNIMGWQYDGSDGGGQAWYDLGFAVDHTDANIIYSGGVNIFKSTDGGVTWKINAHWVGQGAPAVHADHHDLAVNPLNKKIYTANDGGIYWTSNGGTSWSNITDGISISQIYKIGQSQTERDRVLAGNQDNGTSYFEDGTWAVILGGDGMECVIDWEDERYMYQSLYYGAVYRSINGNNKKQIAGQGVGGITEQGEWVTPYTLSTSDPKKMYIGMNNLWRTTNVKASSPSWTKTTSSIASSSSKITVVENSQANDDIMYISRTDRQTYVSSNVNATTPTWTKVNSLPTAYITDIASDYTDENIAYATASNNHVYKTVNRGVNWTKITGNLPRVSMNTIAIDKNSNEGLYVGTDIGVFYKDATMENWILYSTNFPASAKVTEIEIHFDDVNPENNILRASTYGRGLWETDLFTEKVSQEHDARITALNVAKEDFEVSDNIEISFTLRNIGSSNLTDVSVEFILDNAAPTNFSWTGNLATHNNESVPVPTFLSNSGNHNFVINLTKADGTTIASSISGTFNVNNGQAIQVDLTTDLTGSETSYTIEDLEGNILFASEALSDTIHHILESYPLNTGCYNFIVRDANGLGSGSYTLNNLSTNTVLGTGSDFTLSDTVAFCIDTFPTADFSVSPSNVQYKTNLSINNNAIMESYTYTWNFGKDAVPATSNEATPPELMYNTGGYKTVSLSVENNGSVITKTIPQFISVFDPVVINNQTNDLSVCASQNIELIVNTSGFGLIYQWYFDGTSIYGENDSILLIENAQSYNVGTYYCKVSNEFYELDSDGINVTVKDVPSLSITANPASVCAGQEVTLTATGDGEFTWSHNLGTTAEVTDTPEETTTYYVYLSNDEGCTTSQQVTVEVASMPVVTAFAENLVVCEGKSAFLKIEAEGGALSYLWKKDGEDYAEGSNTLLIESTTLNDNGIYSCFVSNVCGSDDSKPSNLKVDPLPVADFTYETAETTAAFTNESEYGKTYSWEFGDGTSSTMIDPSHKYQEGDYETQLIARNDCGSDTITQQVSVYLDGIDELFANESLKVFPNPTNGPFSMIFNSDEYQGEMYITVTNMEGKVVSQRTIEKNSTEINIPVNTDELSKGLYQLSITFENRALRRKVMVY